MFEATVSDAKKFSKAIEAVSTLINEGEFHASEEGLELKTMDPSQIAMVSFNMPKESFEEYKTDGEDIGVNFRSLTDVLKRSRTGENLKMELDQGKTMFNLKFKGNTERKFVIPLLDLRSNSTNAPDIDFSGNITINGSFLKKSLKDAELVSSHVVLQATPGNLSISAEGDRGEVSIDAEEASDAVFEIDFEEEAKAMFPLEYLNDLLKNVSSKTDVKIRMKTDAPLEIKYSIGEAEIAYYLAPRIESE